MHAQGGPGLDGGDNGLRRRRRLEQGGGGGGGGGGGAGGTAGLGHESHGRATGLRSRNSGRGGEQVTGEAGLGQYKGFE